MYWYLTSGVQVLVRDGGTAQSDLLISDTGASPPPSRVETSQNKLRLEFITRYETSSTERYGGREERIAATFETIGKKNLIQAN